MPRKTLSSCLSMKLLLTLALSLPLCAADLGVISPRRAITLNPESDRPDFLNFTLELLPKRSPTNMVTLTITNLSISVEDLVRVPSGRVVMVWWANYADGTQSEASTDSFFLSRGRPAKPSATPTTIGHTNEAPRSATNELRKRWVAPPMPSLPGQVEKSAARFPPPLPHGTNKAYAQHLDEMARREGKRRNE